MGLSETAALKRFKFADLAALLYRDDIRQKHATRSRLAAELEDKKATEAVALKRFIAEKPPACVDPMVEMFIEHLLVAPKSN